MTDYTTRKGANALADRIRGHWAKQGHHVSFKLQDAPFMPAMRSGRVDLRSDMLNGWPRDYALKVLAERAQVRRAA